MRLSPLAWLCLSLLASCSSSPGKEIIVHVPTPIVPPHKLVEPCESPASDGTFQGELVRLSQLVQCERDDKAAIIEWANKVGVEIQPAL